MNPKIQCPLCGKRYFTRQQVMDCMDLDQKENMARNRRLKLIRQYQKS